MAEMNPYYLTAKNREIPPEKRIRRRKDDDFRDVDDMHTAIYYFENGKFHFTPCSPQRSIHHTHRFA
jgi:hypothetical protein